MDTDQGKSGTEVTEVTETTSGAMSTATTIPTEPSSLSTPVFPPIPQYGFTQINPYGCVWPPVIRPTHYHDVWRWRPVLPSIPVKQQESITETPEEMDECPKESDNIKPINIPPELTDPVSSTADPVTPLLGIVKFPYVHSTRESQFAIVPLLLEKTNKVLLYNAYPAQIAPHRSKELKTDIAFQLQAGVEGHIKAHWEGDLAPYGNRYVKVSKTRIYSTCVDPIIITAINKGELPFHISRGDVIAEVLLYQ